MLLQLERGTTMSEHIYDNHNQDKSEATSIKAFNRLKELATGENSELHQYDCSILDHDLNKLSLLNKEDAGTVRSARFNDGAFLSFRLEEKNQLYQYDYSFYNCSQEIPGIVKWRVIDYNGLTRSEYPRNLRREHELYDQAISVPTLNAVAILAAEVSSSTPWSRSYNQNEISSTQKRKSLKRVLRIAINPDLGEPYL